RCGWSRDRHAGAARRPEPATRAARQAWLRCSQGVEPELAQRHFAVGPVFLDLDPEFQMHRALPQIVELDAGEPPDFLQPFAALTDHDGLLPGALDPDDGVD